MRAKLVYEKFTESGDPIRDLGIGAVKHLNNILKPLKTIKGFSWNNIDVIEDELILQLETSELFSVISLNNNSIIEDGPTWQELGVTGYFKQTFYYHIELEKYNIIERLVVIENKNIKSLTYEKLDNLGKPLNLTAEEVFVIICEDYYGFNPFLPIKEIYQELKRINGK
jgi:hypothetical protein